MKHTTSNKRMRRIQFGALDAADDNARAKKMSATINGGGRPDGPVKVRLDARTIVTLANDRMIEFWRQRYPDLKII